MATTQKTRYMFVGDFHVPYHDAAALRAVLDVAKRKIAPDVVVIIGDFLDFYPLSNYDKDPSRAFSLDDELITARTVLDHIRSALPDPEIYYIIGNHEMRLLKFLRTRAPELHGLKELDLSNLLRLSDYRVRLVRDDYDMPSDHYAIAHNFLAVHGHIVRKYAGATAAAMIQEYFTNGVSGHTHRLAFVTHRDKSGRTYGWVENGCLCNLNPEYVKNPNWQQGFSFADFVKKRYSMHIVPVIDREPILFDSALE